MDGRRCFIRIGWTDDVVLRVDGRTTLFYKDGMDGRRCFIRMGWTDDVVL